MSTDTSTPAITAVAAPPMETLADLRSQQSSLLQRDAAGAGTAKPSPGEILGFLESASKLGRSLEGEDARETAQGIMDFWIARLLSEAPQATESSRPFILEELDECSAQLVADDAQQLRVEAVQAARRADDIIATTPPDMEGVKKLKATQRLAWVPGFLKPLALRVAWKDEEGALLKRLLLRFVRLKENALEAYTVPVTSDDTIFRETHAQQTLDQLIDAGVVRKQEIAGTGPSSYVLAHDSLITNWSFLRDIVTHRKAFRELARGWENGKRQPAALLTTGEQIEQALDYPHLDELEDAFVEASRRAGENFRRLALTLVTTAVIVLSGMVYWLWESNKQLEKVATALKEANAAKDKAAIALIKANKDIQQKAAIEGVLISRLYSVRETLLTPLDKSGKPLRLDEPSDKNTKWNWLPSENPVVSKSAANRVMTVLEKVTPPEFISGRPQMEMFVPLETSDAAFGQFIAYQTALTKPTKPGDLQFQFPARVPLPRRTVPDKGKKTEVRYFYDGAGAKGEDEDPKAAAEDADKPLAEEVMRRLIDAGFKAEKITIVPKPDPTAPENFIQVSFARGALD